MEQWPDTELITAYRKGTQAALDVLIRRYLRPAYRFAARLTGDADDAADVVQDAFLKMWQKIGSFDATRPFKPWLFLIIRNTAFDRLKKKTPLAFSEMDEGDAGSETGKDIADLRPLPPEVIGRQELGQELSVLLQTLPPKSRAVVLLHETEELTFQDIADATREPLNTVKSRYRRAILALRKELTGRLGQ